MSGRIVHAFHGGGHRASYLVFLSERLNLEAITGNIDLNVAKRLIMAEQLLFATVSGRTAFKAVLIALVRSILGKRTTAICMTKYWYRDLSRPLVTRITALIFRFLSAHRRLFVFSIIPYRLMPELKESTSDWILDICLWDLPNIGRGISIPRTRLSTRVVEVASGRKIVAFLGKVSRRKNYFDLVQSAGQMVSDVFVVSAGIVTDECRAAAVLLESMGMIVEDRRISEEELISLYGVCDYVWCRYDSHSSSMSSGVFGRAVQLGRAAVVTENSYLDQLASLLGHPVVHELDLCRINAPNRIVADSKQAILPAQSEADRLASLAQHSLAKLQKSLDHKFPS